jgi:hypothetical protein
MDLSGQTLLQDFRFSQRHVRMVICQDFVRVGESLRIGTKQGSQGAISLKAPEFRWPDRDAYRYEEHSLKSSPGSALQPTEGVRHESSRATRIG